MTPELHIPDANVLNAFSTADWYSPITSWFRVQVSSWRCMRSSMAMRCRQCNPSGPMSSPGWARLRPPTPRRGGDCSDVGLCFTAILRSSHVGAARPLRLLSISWAPTEEDRTSRPIKGEGSTRKDVGRASKFPQADQAPSQATEMLLAASIFRGQEGAAPLGAFLAGGCCRRLAVQGRVDVQFRAWAMIGPTVGAIVCVRSGVPTALAPALQGHQMCRQKGGPPAREADGGCAAKAGDRYTGSRPGTEDESVVRRVVVVVVR